MTGRRIHGSDKDGDIYVYDACTMSALVDKGIIRVLPEIIDTSKVFDWILDRSKIRGKTYGFPFMTCANVLICRKKRLYSDKQHF